MRNCRVVLFLEHCFWGGDCSVWICIQCFGVMSRFNRSKRNSTSTILLYTGICCHIDCFCYSYFLICCYFSGHIFPLFCLKYTRSESFESKSSYEQMCFMEFYSVTDWIKQISEWMCFLFQKGSCFSVGMLIGFPPVPIEFEREQLSEHTCCHFCYQGR